MVFIIDHIHHLMNESEMLIFAYHSDRRVYSVCILLIVTFELCTVLKRMISLTDFNSKSYIIC